MEPDESARYCPRCGGPVDDTAVVHPGCDGPAAALDPPRFCARCGTGLDVRVFSTGVRSTCRRCDGVHPARDPIVPGSGDVPSA